MLVFIINIAKRFCRSVTYKQQRYKHDSIKIRTWFELLWKYTLYSINTMKIFNKTLTSKGLKRRQYFMPSIISFMQTALHKTHTF